ncbi:MAG: hypothetical protein ACI91T_002273 [Natronomonas sp.]|jgi:hypothetical protein
MLMFYTSVVSDMVSSMWELFVALFRGGERTDDDDDARFVPSPLDLSVRVAHGGGDDEAARELSTISEQAHELEERQRDH